MPNTVKVLMLTTDEKSSLEALLRCPTTEARKYIRAKILLLKSDSYSNEAIASKLDIKMDYARAYPKKEKMPTKISFFKGNSELMKILIKNTFGAYNPESAKKLCI